MGAACHAGWLTAAILVLLCLHLGPGSVVAQEGVDAGAQRAALRAMLDTESRLLRLDQQAYLEAREQERSARGDLEGATAELDAVLATRVGSGQQLGVAELESLEVQRAVAGATAEIVSSRVEQLRQSILERNRRLSGLRQELGRFGGPAAGGDPITGRWSVTLASPRQSGLFELRLQGAVITGTYVMDTAAPSLDSSLGLTAGVAGAGSVRGTYLNGNVRLERIDQRRGLDGVLEGEVDASLGLMRGFYSPSELSSGGAGGAGWTGLRISTEVTGDLLDTSGDASGDDAEGEQR